MIEDLGVYRRTVGMGWDGMDEVIQRDEGGVGCEMRKGRWKGIERERDERYNNGIFLGYTDINTY